MSDLRASFYLAFADRRALLAEVDRLAMAENDMGLTAMLIERARIRAAVEGLRDRQAASIHDVGAVYAAVLAIVKADHA